MFSSALRRNIAIYGLYLSLLGIVGIAVRFLGLDTTIGIWAAIGIACVFAILWPRW